MPRYFRVMFMMPLPESRMRHNIMRDTHMSSVSSLYESALRERYRCA